MPNSHDIAKPESATQARVLQLFQNDLGYDYLGDWSDRPGNSNIETGLLTAYLSEAGYTPAQISAALYQLNKEASHPDRTLYGNNQAVYGLLRYGVPVKTEAGKPTETVHLINWKQPEKNHFAVAQEVTLKKSDALERRPDVVLYVNGMAMGVLELKNSRTSIGTAVQQNLSNQRPEFNQWFFSTVQLILAGNDSQGLQYGTIGTEAKYFLTWKEDEHDNSGYKLDKYLRKLCNKQRLLELVHDFVLFDNGVKKLPRVHQYFGLKAAQEHVRQRKGGIIWHTQGAGKSILMVLLAKWILENLPQARVVIITDRDELDKQIERVFTQAGEAISRTSSGRDLMAQLAQAKPRLLCSLVHKFGITARQADADFEAFITDLQSQPSRTVGEVFVFVDECHRTQSGKLHRVMKAVMPNAVFIGFTGTPLLKKDKQTSLEVFGGYIHTYKFSEAVEDGVVLDLVYEARDIDQRLSSQAGVDEWFETVSKDLNDWQKDELKKQWGTMQNVLSSESRMRKVVQDIYRDFLRKPRLSSGQGNAILVASSIYEACKYFLLFQSTPFFKNRCAVVTSYNPQAKDVTLEEVGDHNETAKQFVYNTYTDLLKPVEAKPGKSKTETYEDQAKALFIKEPANMCLLIVVDKLLTGFDAPSCTYLYIDKSMQDHGLFQAICRTNRLDGDSKDFGFIVDYKDLFKKVEKAIAVYTSEIDHSAGGADPEVLLNDRLEIGRERLDAALETLFLLCEPVQPPKADLDYMRYFCGNTEIADDLKRTEPQRVAFYKAVVALLRAYGNLADDLVAAGYSEEEIASIKQKMDHYVKLREVIRNASRETLDLKPYEAYMRHLIDTYIEASEPRKISPFDGVGLLDLIVKTGIADAVAEKLANLKGNQEAIAETIENNVRSKIVEKNLTDPAYFAKMSALLDEIIQLRKKRAIEYEEYLAQIAELAKKVVQPGGAGGGVHAKLNTPAKLALYNNLKDSPLLHAAKVAEPAAPYGESDNEGDAAVALAVKLHEAILNYRPDSWRGNAAKENTVKGAMFGVLQNFDEVLRLFPIVCQQQEY